MKKLFLILVMLVASSGAAVAAVNINSMTFNDCLPYDTNS